AAAKGFYKDAGLDVTIKAGGPDIAPTQVIAGKQADIVVDWMPSALAAREAGVPLVNVAQVFNQSGLMLTCKKASGVASPKDFKGKTLGVWYGGNEYPFLNWMGKLGLKTDTDIKILKQGFNVDPLLQNQAACISTMIYNEYWQVVDAGVKEKDLVTFFYEKEGVATLEDGLYVLEANLKDPAFVAKMGKFLKATLKGWDAAVKDPEGAAKAVVAADTSGSASVKVQKRQMENVAKLITNAGTKKIGYLEPAAYERTVKVLLAGGSDPVIKKDPGKAAYSHAIWEAAQK
ncbi:MAG: ABC transporter substrate-binding protein, partial [Rhodoferax sp.]